MRKINWNLTIISTVIFIVGVATGVTITKITELLTKNETIASEEQDVLTIGSCHIFSNILSAADAIDENGDVNFLIALENEQLWQVYLRDVNFARRLLVKGKLSAGSNIRICNNGEDDYLFTNKDRQGIRIHRIDQDLIDVE